jgi:hypothetical protein
VKIFNKSKRERFFGGGKFDSGKNSSSGLSCGLDPGWPTNGSGQD